MINRRKGTQLSAKDALLYRRRLTFAAEIVALCLSACSIANAQNDRVAWEAFRAEAVSPAAVRAVLEIRRQVQEVLDSGNHLGASFQYYADTPSDGYYQYEQPGRIIMMLAYAYPYLSKAQQEAVKSYVKREVADPAYAPWGTNNYLPITNVAKRSRFTQAQVWSWDRYWGMQGQGWDELNGVTLYGLWLFAYKSGEWSLVNNHWNAIATRYTAMAPGGNLYGTYGMHIAQARMAQHRGDAAARTAALNNLNNRLSEGRTFATVDAANARYFGYFTNERLAWGYHFGGMFLYLSNEIGRWLRDGAPALREAVIARQNEGKSKFTNWWLYRLPVFCRWSGDEGVGVPSEIIGMMFPVERWITNPSPDSLLAYTIWNAQNAVGDCHVVEAIVQTIDACGTEKWRDVRNASFTGPGILLLSAGEPIDERLLIDNPRGQTLAVSYLTMPAFITGAGDGSLAGTAPSSPQTSLLRAVLSADGNPVDTIAVTVVVADIGSLPARGNRRHHAASGGAVAILGARVQGNTLLVRCAGSAAEALSLMLVDQSGRTVIRKSVAGGGEHSLPLGRLQAAGVYRLIAIRGNTQDARPVVLIQ